MDWSENLFRAILRFAFILGLFYIIIFLRGSNRRMIEHVEKYGLF